MFNNLDTGIIYCMRVSSHQHFLNVAFTVATIKYSVKSCGPRDMSILSLWMAFNAQVPFLNGKLILTLVHVNFQFVYI